MKSLIMSALVPPVSACRFACGTSCAAPVTVFWLFGVVSIAFGLLGGPMNEPGISWPTIALGLVMWSVASIWTLLTLHGSKADRCQGG